LFFSDGYSGQREFVISSKYLLKKREIQPHENKDVIEFELKNIDSNNLLKEKISAIE